MKSNLPQELDVRLTELLTEIELERGKPQTGPSMNLFGMQLRSLRNLCPSHGTDLDGTLRRKQIQGILNFLQKDKTIPDSVAKNICKWLDDYGIATL